LQDLSAGPPQELYKSKASPQEEADMSIELFLSYLAAERGLSENTITNYGQDLRQFGELLPNGLDKASRDEVRQVFIELQSGGMTASSLARKMSTLRHFYAYLRRKHLVATIPLSNIPLPKLGKRLPKPISTTDFGKLLNAVDTTTKMGVRDCAILRLFDSCGLRCSELVKLTPGDLHLEEGYIVVHHGKGDKDRFVPIDAPGAKALSEYMLIWPALYPNETRIFPLSRQRIWILLQELCERAKITPKHPHQLRHRFGSELTKSGLEMRDVADLMGHSSVDTTLQYVGLDLGYMREIFRKTHPRAVRL
jgi:integrase/recombinase XerD